MSHFRLLGSRIGLLLALSTAPSPIVAQERPAGAVANEDVVCGPRSALHVLEHYGRQEELLELVREMQFPDMDKGCSLADIEQAIRRRGLYVCSLDVSRTTEVRWPHPVVVHSKVAGRALGHFECFVPTLHSGDLQLWRVAPNTSGAILLTSDRPIDRAVAVSSMIETRPSDVPWMGSSVAAISLVLLCLSYRRTSNLR